MGDGKASEKSRGDAGKEAEEKLREDKKTRSKVVEAREGSFLVRAPAGSGKTTLLASRYVALVGGTVAPENVLCVTFTRKAAGEMRRKILKCLAGRVDADRVRVQTIDSFQGTLARADSLMAGVMPRFRTTEGTVLLDRAMGEAAEEMKGIGEVATGFHTRYDLHRKVRGMLRKRDQWLGRASGPGRQANAPSRGDNVIAKLRGIAETHLERVQWMGGEYDYLSVSRAATKLVERVGGGGGLGPVLGHAVNHILVDEFQDVSAAQYEFLVALTRGWKKGDGRTFFGVGDSMQSIYRWRGAGTGVILGMFESEAGARVASIGGLELEVRQLWRNFRSEKTVVEGAFELLKKVEPKTGKEKVVPKTGKRKRGEAKLVKGVADREGSDGATGEFALRVFGEEGEEEREVVETIEKCRRDRVELGVLVRARRHFTERIAPRLGFLDGIDVAFGGLAREACVNDLWVLARFVEDKGDEAAGLALLRSPLVGLGSREILEMYREWGEVARKEGSTPVAWAVEEFAKGGGGGRGG